MPHLRAPVVLVHGLLGFDRLQLAGWRLADYFHGLEDMLSAAGNRVIVASLSPTAGIAERANQLKELIDRESPTEPVHVFGHSLGGLDSRYMISQLAMGDRVSSLTTLGTPHRGTSFADWGVHRFDVVLDRLFDFFGLPAQAFRDLTVASCERFNARVLDRPGVRYFSVAGQLRLDWLSLQWHVPATMLEKLEGPNDGVVSVASARWGEAFDVWNGDHMSLVNWRHPLAPVQSVSQDRLKEFADLLRRLADLGF
ncbi:MAG: lipase family alpha/beta hydrolase [Candidatus Acidiferrum sp.]